MMANIASIFGFLGIAGTFFISAWALFKYILLGTYRLNGDASKRLFDKIENDASWTWILSGEHVTKPKYPDVHDVLAVLGGMIFYFSRGERLFTAGWKNKEDLSTVTFLRWQKKKIEKLLNVDLRDSASIPISALIPGSQDRLGSLEADENAKVYLNAGTYEDIEEDVKKVIRGISKKTGILLYGSPGSGKTQFIKYLSKKYSLPIYVVYLQADYSNYDIVRMFSEIPQRCIVLMEDFDNYFNGRECVIKNEQVRFTFDSVINALDGVHNDYKGVIFAMTTNNIDAVDDSLKSRPSRFKFVREFGLPNAEIRNRILQNEDLVLKSEGFTLDQVFSLKGLN
jgi:adenylate kinase family enzyme